MTQTKLTDEEIDAIQEECDCHGCDSCDIRIHEFARAIESAVLSRTITDDEWMEEAERLARSLSSAGFRHGSAYAKWMADSYNDARQAEADNESAAKEQACAALLAHLRRRPAAGEGVSNPYPTLLASSIMVEHHLTHNGKVPPGTLKDFRRAIQIAQASPPGGEPASPSVQEASPAQSAALERQRRLVATLPQTREQAALLAPCAALGKGTEPVRCGHCGKTVTAGGACVSGSQEERAEGAQEDQRG